MIDHDASWTQQIHTSPMWACNRVDTHESTAFFTTAEELREHLKIVHANFYHDEEHSIASILETSIVEPARDPHTCLLCCSDLADADESELIGATTSDELPPVSIATSAHVAEHLENIMVLSLNLMELQQRGNEDMEMDFHSAQSPSVWSEPPEVPPTEGKPPMPSFGTPLLRPTSEIPAVSEGSSNFFSQDVELSRNILQTTTESDDLGEPTSRDLEPSKIPLVPSDGGEDLGEVAAEIIEQSQNVVENSRSGKKPNETRDEDPPNLTSSLAGLPGTFSAKETTRLGKKKIGYANPAMEPEPTLQAELFARLKKSNFHDPEQDYIPSKDVKRLITVAIVQKEIQNYDRARRLLTDPDQIEKYNDIGDDHKNQLAHWIPEHGYRTFAAAVVSGFNSLDLIHFMVQYAEQALDDEYLPSEQAEELVQKCVPELAKVRSFRSARWSFLAPIFSPRQYDYDLSGNCVFPFERDVLVSQRGTFGSVSKVRVHPDHQEHRNMGHVSISTSRTDSGSKTHCIVGCH